MKEFSKWLGIGLVLMLVIVFVLLAINYILPADWQMGSEILLVLVGAILSVMFTYIPSLRIQFAGLSSTQKSLVNLVLMILMGVVMFVGTCSLLLPIPGIECSQAGVKTLALYIFLAAGGNQLAYVASPQPVDVVNAKMDRDFGAE